MKRFQPLALATLLLLSLPAFAQTSYSEAEPNNIFPAQFLPGNPTLLSGDSMVGHISSGDVDQHYLTLQGAGSTGIYRYQFDMNTHGGDSLLTIFDTHGSTLGYNDDFYGVGTASRVTFDHFDTTGGNVVFGAGIEGYDLSQNFDYAMTVSRTLTPVTNLGTLPSGRSQIGSVLNSGEAAWYRFTIGQGAAVTLDTFGSVIDETGMTLLNAQGNPIANGAFLDSNDLRMGISQYLNAGTYYLALGSSGSYYNLRNAVWDRNGFSSGVLGGSYLLNISVVPEPGTFVLLSGILFTGGALRLRRSGKRCSQKTS